MVLLDVMAYILLPVTFGYGLGMLCHLHAARLRRHTARHRGDEDTALSFPKDPC